MFKKLFKKYSEKYDIVEKTMLHDGSRSYFIIKNGKKISKVTPFFFKTEKPWRYRIYDKTENIEDISLERAKFFIKYLENEPYNEYRGYVICNCVYKTTRIYCGCYFNDCTYMQKFVVIKKNYWSGELFLEMEHNTLEEACAYIDKINEKESFLSANKCRVLTEKEINEAK